MLWMNALEKIINNLMLVGSLLLRIKLLWNDARAETFSIFPFIDFPHSHSSPMTRSIPRCCSVFFFFFLSKQRGETLQGFWFLLLLCHCHIILTDTEKTWQPAAPKKKKKKIVSFFKFEFWFWGRSTAQELKGVSLSGEISAAWEKLPRDHSTFAAVWLRDKTGQTRKTKQWRTHTYIIMLMINADD